MFRKRINQTNFPIPFYENYTAVFIKMYVITILHNPPLNYANSFTGRPSPRRVERGSEFIS